MGGDDSFAVTLGRALDAIPDLAADAPMMSPSAGQTEHENATGGSEGVSMARALFKSFVANLTGETTDVPSPDTAFEASKSRQRERNPSAKHAVSPTGGQNRSATPVPTAAQPVSAPAWLPVYQGNSFPAQAETPEVERKYDDAVQASNVEPAPASDASQRSPALIEFTPAAVQSAPASDQTEHAALGVSLKARAASAPVSADNDRELDKPAGPATHAEVTGSQVSSTLVPFANQVGENAAGTDAALSGSSSPPPAADDPELANFASRVSTFEDTPVENVSTLPPVAGQVEQGRPTSSTDGISPSASISARVPAAASKIASPQPEFMGAEISISVPGGESQPVATPQKSAAPGQPASVAVVGLSTLGPPPETAADRAASPVASRSADLGKSVDGSATSHIKGISGTASTDAVAQYSADAVAGPAATLPSTVNSAVPPRPSDANSAESGSFTVRQQDAAPQPGGIQAGATPAAASEQAYGQAVPSELSSVGQGQSGQQSGQGASGGSSNGKNASPAPSNVNPTNDPNPSILTAHEPNPAPSSGDIPTHPTPGIRSPAANDAFRLAELRRRRRAASSGQHRSAMRRTARKCALRCTAAPWVR